MTTMIETTETRDARIDAACRALDDAHRAVADTAGAWVAEGCPPLPPDIVADAGYAWAQRGCPCAEADERADAATDLHDAVRRWRAAGEALMVAMRGDRS